MQEHDIGIRRGWFGRRGEVGVERLLGFEIMSLLTPKRSAMVARSRRSGAMAL